MVDLAVNHIRLGQIMKRKFAIFLFVALRAAIIRLSSQSWAEINTGPAAVSNHSHLLECNSSPRSKGSSKFGDDDDDDQVVRGVLAHRDGLGGAEG